MIRTIIIADNLVNDYCGLQERYFQNNVHIGLMEAEKLLGREENLFDGPIPTFLRQQKLQKSTHVVYLRDYYQPGKSQGSEQLKRLGNHCIKGSTGEEFVQAIQDLVPSLHVVNNQGLSFPLEGLASAIKSFADIDLLNIKEAGPQAAELRFLLMGFHTERRIFAISSVLRNLFGFKHVAVFSHFMGSTNREAHFAALQFQFPENLIQVLNNTFDLARYLGQDLSYLDKFKLDSVKIEPTDVNERLNEHQKDIIESICIHWTEAHLQPMGSGYSNSELFLARGKQGSSKTEPMVIKIDSHYPIRLEIKGYNLVKNFLGKHVPTLTVPVSSGPYSGVGMELASMQGSTTTLQKKLEGVDSDYKLDDFMNILDRILVLFMDRIYVNTKRDRQISPYRHFKLHLSQQAKWLKANIANIMGHQIKQISTSPAAIEKIFSAISQNNDMLECEMCIAHGDLNMSNLIADQKDNLWAIDWTYTGLHPIASDFAKLENDVKFVISKDLREEDLPKLKLFEDFLLQNRLLCPISELPEELKFIAWDIRFKKIYQPVRAFRLAYSQLQKDTEWLMYKIALLRYALHTLSFDRSLERGECTPVQLWYALLSVEILVFLLVGDDFHLKIRAERPEDYPDRYRIPIDMAPWKIESPEYDPPYYISPKVLQLDRTKNPMGEADTEARWDHPMFTNWGEIFTRTEDGKPLNPRGRTGISGRGDLWLWGGNPMLFLIPVFYHKEIQQFEVLINTKLGESDLICIHFRRGESFEEALKRAQEKIQINLGEHYSMELHEGYLYDYRQTDNAWVEAQAFLTYSDSGSSMKGKQSGDLKWKLLDHKLINEFRPSYANLLRSAVQHLYDVGIHQEKFIIDILEKTA